MQRVIPEDFPAPLGLCCLLSQDCTWLPFSICGGHLCGRRVYGKAGAPAPTMGSHVVLSYCFTSSSGPSAIACLFLLILLRFLVASAWVGTGDLSSAASPSCTQFFCVIALRYAKQQWLLLFCFQKDRNPDPSITLYPMQKLQESDIFSFFLFFLNYGSIQSCVGYFSGVSCNSRVILSALFLVKYLCISVYTLWITYNAQAQSKYVVLSS